MAVKKGFVSYAPAPLSGESAQQLAAALQLELLSISAAFENVGGGLFITPLSQSPNKVRALMLVYADGVNWDPHSGEGLYVRNLANTEWLYLATPGTAGRHAFPVTSVAMRPSAVGGCAALAIVATSAGHPDLATLNFDATTTEYAQFSIPMPKAWNESTITASFIWSHATASTDFGVVWGLQAVAVSDGGSIDVAYGTAQEVTDTGGTANTQYRSPETAAITVGGSPAAEDVVHFRVYRNAASAADTLAVDARLHAVVLYITTDAETDS